MIWRLILTMGLLATSTLAVSVSNATMLWYRPVSAPSWPQMRYMALVITPSFPAACRSATMPPPMNLSCCH